MGQYRETTREVTIAAGADTRVWDAPTGSPLKRMTIVVSSGGTPTTAANIDQEVLFGGQWAGTPFDTDSTHTGGVSQAAAAALTAATEVAHIIYEDVSLMPTNIGGPTVQRNMRRYGLPVVLELTNNGAAPITLFVTFISETIGTNV